MNSFRVGQKVVWLGDVYALLHPGDSTEVDDHPLEEGGIYTISNLYVTDDEVVMVELVEHPAPETDEFDAGFPAIDFRPAVSDGTETGMSILRELLNTQDKPVEVLA